MPDSRNSRTDPRLDWLKLAGIGWIGETVKAGLIKHFRTPDAVFRADRRALSEVKGWTHQRLDRFLAEGRHAPPLCDPGKLDGDGLRFITFNDPEYPPLLRETHDAPIVLFGQGTIVPDDRPHFAIVGARNGSQLGFDLAREFGHDLAAAGFVIVSGLALGIDTFAHLGALDAGSRTIAILGCGVDQIYPSGNRKIRERILGQGALLSEFPPGEPPRPWHFPVRNRIISGMCVGTLVVEATARSGSLITARLAGDQDRDVFAIPGSVRANLSQGTLSLLRDGAHLVTSPAQIVDFYSHLLPASAHQEEEAVSPLLEEDEALLVSVLSNDPVSVDRLLGDGRWSRDRLFSMLLTLEMRDILTKLPGNLYQSKIKPPLGR